MSPSFKHRPGRADDAPVLADILALTDTLRYHVVSGEVLAETVVTLDATSTVQGSDIFIAVEGESVILNGSVNVTATDVLASNGVIHVIDAILLPPAAADTSAPAPGSAGNAAIAGSSVSNPLGAAPAEGGKTQRS